MSSSNLLAAAPSRPRLRIFVALAIALAVGVGATAAAASAGTINVALRGGGQGLVVIGTPESSPVYCFNGQVAPCTTTFGDNGPVQFAVAQSTDGGDVTLSGDPSCRSSVNYFAFCTFDGRGRTTNLVATFGTAVAALVAAPSIDGQGNLSAMYVDANGQPMKGRTIAFTAPDQNGNTKTLCVAKTNAKGVAARDGRTFAKSFAARDGVLYTATSDDGLTAMSPLANARTIPTTTATTRAVGNSKHRAHGTRHKARGATRTHR